MPYNILMGMKKKQKEREIKRTELVRTTPNQTKHWVRVHEHVVLPPVSSSCNYPRRRRPPPHAWIGLARVFVFLVQDKERGMFVAKKKKENKGSDLKSYLNQMRGNRRGAPVLLHPL